MCGYSALNIELVQIGIFQVLSGFVGAGQRAVEYLASCGIWVVTSPGSSVFSPSGEAQSGQLGEIPAGLFGP